jgi:hypothetical protein
MIYYDNDTDSVMREMVARGPVISLMFAYKDFYAYKSGVYTVTPGNDNGIVGWFLVCFIDIYNFCV